MDSKEASVSNRVNEKSIDSKIENLYLAQFFEQTSDFCQKIENKFSPLLDKIDFYRHQQLYHGIKEKIDINTKKINFFADKANNHSSAPQKITIKKENHEQKISSVSFAWLQGTDNENLFLKIKFREEKLESIERRVKPNTIFKKTYEAKGEKKYELDPNQTINNQVIKFEVSHDPIRLKMTLGYLTGRQFFFIYPDNKTDNQLVISEGFKIVRPNLGRVINQIRKIEDEFLK